jgi:catechol 2,3-dioxygenase-like lactoylglutathione lyase family enzyme
VSETSDLIGATGHRAVPVTPDISDRSSTEAARDRVTDAPGRVDIAAIKRKHDPQNLFHHNANIQPAQAGGRPDNRSDISMLGNHPITPVLLATDLAAAREFYHGKLELQIDRENENAIVLRCGNGTHLDVTESTVGTADQQTQAAWQVSDIRAEVAELHARGIKVEDYDTPGLKTKDGIADIGFAWAASIIDPATNVLGILQIKE